MTIYKNIHIFTRESTYASALLESWSNNLNLSGNLIVFRDKKNIKFKYSDVYDDKIVYISNFFKFLIFLTPQLFRSKRIIFHFLPIGPSLLFYRFFPRLLKKSVWSVWGGDVYHYMIATQKRSSRVWESLRRIIIPKIPEITALVKEDFEAVVKHYKSTAEYKYTFYFVPLDYNYLNLILTKKPESKKKRILIGNSAVATNNHLEVFNELRFLNDQPVEIIVPLSYGNEGHYVENIINDGKRIFGDQFIPLTQFMPANEYSDLLVSIDVAVMNQVRSQGLGNVLPLLYLKKKVYLRSDSSSFKFLKRIGCTIFDTLELKNQTFEDIFTGHDFTKNHKIIEREMSKERCAEVWKQYVES